jgi:Kef-type K+ transport system membrane component KefB
MSTTEVTQLLGLLALILVAAKGMNILARRMGVPPLLGELLAGILLGGSGFQLINADHDALGPIVEIGFVLFLFHVGLELDLGPFKEAVRPATAVAIVGTILPLLWGYLSCQLLGFSNEVALGAGVAITATSLGVTARVLADLNRLNDPESQIIIWGAALGNILSLFLLKVISELSRGTEVTLGSVALNSTLTYGFLVLVLLVGRKTIGLIFRVADQVDSPGLHTALAVTLAFTLAWLTSWAGAPASVGALLAGLLVARLPKGEQIRQQVMPFEEVFVSIAFVCLGAVIDLRALNPLQESARPILATGLLLTLAAAAGKFVAGYAPFWFHGNKRVIGLGMIAHGEIGLLFAQVVLTNKLLDRTLFSAVAFAVIATTFLGILALQASLGAAPRPRLKAEEVATEEMPAAHVR